ncbi:polysaccharide deacetylase family protein [Parasediminibacterium paludis]|uniref:Polysaccharide deacetylase family protein n=1 Tax=Parasediminibacterium paludis TaxID=908966 RepID=A0ABV8PXZ7_9BACT
MGTIKLYATSILLFASWVMSCQNASFSAVANDDKKPKKASVPIDKFARKAFVYDSTKNYIYLTFDDGPQNGTQACFDLCKQLGVKATFFMVGEHASSPKTKAIVAGIREAYPNFLLCNHSTTHASGHYKYFYHHPEMAAEDFYAAQKSLNVPYKIIRLPGNSAWVLKDTIKASHLVDSTCILLNSTGYNVIGWDVEWSFNHKTENPVQKPQRMVDIVDSALAKPRRLFAKNHVVILSHDRMFRNPSYTDSLAKFITILKQNPKNVFETIDHYPGLK